MKPIEESGVYQALTDRGVPPTRARVKVQHSRKGWLFVILGAVCIAGGFAFIVWTMIVTKGAPSLPLLVFAALPALPGAYFLLAGGHMISWDAMRAAEESGGVLAKTAARALRLARGKE
jgi:nitrate reductase NapE component